MSIVYFLIEDFELTHPCRTDTGKMSHLNQIYGQARHSICLTVVSYVLHSVLRKKYKNQYSTTSHDSPTNFIHLVYLTYSLVGVQNWNIQ